MSMGGVLVQGSNEMETERMNRSKHVHGEICINYAHM